MMMSKRFIGIWLTLLLAIAAYIRVSGANDYHYSVDEAMHLWIAGTANITQLLQFSLNETHPPLLYLLYHCWLTVFSDPALVRCLSLLFGLSLILVYYRIGRELNGEMTGLCCAALIAFSHGCIIQSYIVRHYVFFTFFLSLSFYYYLVWFRTRTRASLACYAVFGCLAAFTHFTALFAYACLAGFGAFRLWREKTGWSQKIRWAIANAVILLIAAVLYAIWHERLAAAEPDFNAFYRHHLAMIPVFTALYPVALLQYLFPGYASAVALIFVLLVLAFLPGFAVRADRSLRPLLAFSCTGMGFGMCLFATSIYTLAGTRHSLWTLPFTAPLAGWVFADALTHLSAGLTRMRPAPWPAILSCLVLAGGWAMYSPADRYADDKEYMMTRPQWEQLNRFALTLTAHDMIVMEKDDIMLFANPYPYISAPYTGRMHAVTVPYGSTRILFNQFFRRMHGKQMLVALLEDARRQHLLDGINRLVFLKTVWSDTLVTDLMLCDRLDKTILAFPSGKPLPSLTFRVIDHMHAVVMTVPYPAFFDQALSPSGQAHDCVAGARDSEQSIR